MPKHGTKSDSPAAGRPGAAPAALPKVLGGDTELGNFIQGLPAGLGNCRAAVLALLAEIPGVPGSSGSTAYARVVPSSYSGYGDWDGTCGESFGYCGSPHYLGGYGTYAAGGRGGGSQGGYDPQDWGRRYLRSNGGCCYDDLNHLELCVPECRSALDHLAAWHAMLRIARDARERANAKLPPGQRIQVLVNNSDGRGNSYGSHLNVAVTRRCWDNLFLRRLHYLLYLASYQVSAIVFAGGGKVGSENGRPHADFQISQRADFDEQLVGLQTTYHRPIVNSRDESLTGAGPVQPPGPGSAPAMARLHCIFFDNTLCHVSTYLKAGVTQLVLAAIEQEHVAADLILDDPLQTLTRWSHDPLLRAKARLVNGQHYTAVELQLAMLERIGRFVAAGKADGLVPGAADILALWAETLDELKRGDLSALAGKCDWVLKRCALEQAMAGRNLQWTSPQIKLLDHLYGSLDANEGLYWAYERAGVVRRLVSPGQIERFVHQPPDDTRAYLRAQVLRRADPDSIVSVDWDRIRFRFPRNPGSYWLSYDYLDLPMGDPLQFTRAQCQSVLDRAATFRQAVLQLGGRSTDPTGGALALPATQATGAPRQSDDKGPTQVEGGTAHGDDSQEC